MDLRTRRLVLIGCLGILSAVWLIWAMGHTEPPGPVLAATIIGIVAVAAVGPWAALAIRKLSDDLNATHVIRRAIKVAAVIALVGAAGAVAARDSIVVMFSILVAGVFALVGAVLVPWIFLLTRTVTRERAARARAEERAEVAAHLHDSVLQSLTLTQKQSDDSAAVRRLARSTERELRAWLYRAPVKSDDDFAGAVRTVSEEIEDRFAVTVELVTVGTCPADERVLAVVGALREALTNAAMHSGVRRVSVLAEVSGAEVIVLVKDRGRGFDPVAQNGTGRRGIADSIQGRVTQQGGTAVIRSTIGEGTEVELRMPLPVTA